MLFHLDRVRRQSQYFLDYLRIVATLTSNSHMRIPNTLYIFLSPQCFLKTTNTKLICTATDSHIYLLYTSSQPNKRKDTIPHGKYLGIICICSTLSNYAKHMKNMTLHFFDRRYPLDPLQEAAIKARRTNRYNLLHPSPLASPQNTECLILITNYLPPQGRQPQTHCDH